MHPTLLHYGHISLPTFGVLAACGLMLALALSQRTARLADIDPDRLWDSGLFTILAAFLLSRIILVATYFSTFRQYPMLLLAVPSLTAPGMALTALAAYLWLLFKRVPVLGALDAWAPCATLLWTFLALGHFAEGSDPGLATTLPWGIRMPGESTPLHPIALYAAIIAIMLTEAALIHLKRTHCPGHTAALTLIAAGLAQFLLSFLRQPGLSTLGGLEDLQYVALGMLLTGCTLWLTTQKAPIAYD